jgi:putative transposase
MAEQRRQSPAEGSVGARVKALAADPRHRDGRRRRAQHRQDEGCAVGRATARRLMPRAGGVGPRPTRHGPVTTDRRHGDAGAPNLLARRVDVATLDPVGGGDLCSVWTAAGWWYGSTLVARYARHVGGWAMRNRLETPLGQETLPLARGPRHPAAGLRHHADRGRHDASQASQTMLAAHGMVCRMSRQGAGRDTAVAERCLGS